MAGNFPQDINEVKTATELLKSHANELVKQHTVLDGQGRPKFIFTTYIGAQDQSPCLVTEYVYASPTSSIVIGRQERTYKWKAAWDSGFIFNPSTSYDPDGDGNI